MLIKSVKNGLMYDLAMHPHTLALKSSFSHSLVWQSREKLLKSPNLTFQLTNEESGKAEQTLVVDGGGSEHQKWTKMKSENMNL